MSDETPAHARQHQCVECASAGAPLATAEPKVTRADSISRERLAALAAEAIEPAWYDGWNYAGTVTPGEILLLLAVYERLLGEGASEEVTIEHAIERAVSEHDRHSGEPAWSTMGDVARDAYLAGERDLMPRASKSDIAELERAIKRTLEALAGVDILAGETTIKLDRNDLIVLTSVGRAVLASQHARRILSEAVVGGG